MSLGLPSSAMAKSASSSHDSSLPNRACAWRRTTSCSRIPRKARSCASTPARPAVHAASDLAELCREADIVISAVTADAAVAVAGQAAPHLTSSQTYIDLDSISPATKEQAADQVRQRGAEFVEFAVMAPVKEPGIEVPILSGGRTAEAVSARLNELGMRITPVSTEIGTASATKLCRSIVIKGMEALMVDFTLASEEAASCLPSWRA